MALLDAYATAAQYRTRVGSQASGANATLDTQLLTASRLIERKLDLVPGAFNSAAVTDIVLDGIDPQMLHLRDRAGRAAFFQAITADKFEVDADGDGTYEYAWDLDDAWLRGLPENAAAGSEPYTGFQLLPGRGSPLQALPMGLACFRLSGTQGWATVPDIIVELTCQLVHDLRLGQLAGPQGNLPDFDAVHALSPQTFYLWREAEALYGRRQVAF